MPDTSGESSGRPTGPYIVLTSALIVALVVMNLLILNFNDPNRVLGTHYYVAAGDSVSFGFQPNLDVNHGFADDLEQQLQHEELINKQTGKPAVEINLANFACPGEKTSTMTIDGGCPYRNALKEIYICPPQPSCSQLDAVIRFLNEHKGKVSPVTFEMGANDVLTDWDYQNCSIIAGANLDSDLKAMDDNLTRLDSANPNDASDPNNGILPRMVNALRVGPALPVPGPGQGQVRLAGDFVMLNYYNPFAQKCSNSASFVHEINDHLAQDAALFHIPVVDVYTAFGGDAGMADHDCTYTWFCPAKNTFDNHPTTAGYQVIASAVEQVLGYPNTLPVPVPAQQGGQPAPIAASWKPGA